MLRGCEIIHQKLIQVIINDVKNKFIFIRACHSNKFPFHGHLNKWEKMMISKINQKLINLWLPGRHIFFRCSTPNIGQFCLGFSSSTRILLSFANLIVREFSPKYRRVLALRSVLKTLRYRHCKRPHSFTALPDDIFTAWTISYILHTTVTNVWNPKL